MPLLRDGYSTVISFTAAPAIQLFEKEVTPPGLDGGGPIDNTTMWNNRWRTKWPKSLATATTITTVCAYNPNVYDDILALLQVNTEITVLFPDGSSLEIYGFVDKFMPQSHKEGEQPTAQLVIEVSNLDDAEAEFAPNYVAAP